VLAALVASIPFARALTLDRVFYIRDLSLTFWERHVWLRRSLFAGEWPLWDPYAAAGQSAVADGLHQMFLLPVLAIRMLGTEVVGFNLWVALPFPVAALGAYAFFRSRFSPSAAALGAIAFSVSGPVVSTGNFPNLSWSVAALPWVFWAVDRCLRVPNRRRTAAVSGVTAFQVLAGEPVTMVATVAVALAYTLLVGPPDGWSVPRARVRALVAVCAGIFVAGLVSAVQMLPMAVAVSESWRSAKLDKDFWSFHPLAMAETISMHLFGNYFDTSIMEQVPWMGPLNSRRDPFFYSLYLGPTLFALATFGAVAGWRRTWSAFWTSAGLLGLLASFGPHSPFYPFLQAHLPFIRSFRFPVKYLLIAVMALAALVAGGWDAVASSSRREQAPGRYRAARVAGIGVAAVLAFAAYVASAVVLYRPNAAARWLRDLAGVVGVKDPGAAAAFLWPRITDAMTPVILLSAGAALFLAIATSRRKERRLGQVALYGLLVADLLAAAWGINPTFDVGLFAEPAWTSLVRAHPESRFYFGGQQEGIFDVQDPDAPQAFVPPVELTPAEARGTVANELVLFPAVWHVRAVFSYDLAVLWPRVAALAHSRFLRASVEERRRFLARNGARYRILPPTAADGHAPLVQLKYFQTASLYDWGPGLPRAFVVPGARVVPDLRQELEALFAPGFDVRGAVMTPIAPSQPLGRPGPAATPGARIVSESANRAVVEASTGAGGGYLVLLDTYSPDWQVTVDGQAGVLYRANALYRMVPLVAGRHVVEFRYRPWAFQVGGGVTVVGLLCALGMGFWARRG
jgi:hypothetical protein